MSPLSGIFAWLILIMISVMFMVIAIKFGTGKYVLMDNLALNLMLAHETIAVAPGDITYIKYGDTTPYYISMDSQGVTVNDVPNTAQAQQTNAGNGASSTQTLIRSPSVRALFVPGPATTKNAENIHAKSIIQVKKKNELNLFDTEEYKQP